MGLKRLLLKPLSGYPGGYKRMRRGTQGFDSTPPFKVPDNPRDRRSRIPPTGFREYWYPALPAKDVETDRPEVLRMLGTDVVFFKDKQGEVQALLDWCPHRAVYLSMALLLRGLPDLPVPWGDVRWRRQLRRVPHRRPRLHDGGSRGHEGPQVPDCYPQGHGVRLDG